MKVYNPNAIGVTTGFGVPTGGTSGQLLQKLDGTNYNTQWIDDRSPKIFALPNTTTNGWIFLGTWNTIQNGATLYTRIVSHSGFNANSNQNQVTELYFKTANNISFQAGAAGGNFFGDALAYRNPTLGTSITVPETIRIVQISNTQYQIYGFFNAGFIDNSTYQIQITPGTTWVHSGTQVSAPTGTYINVTPNGGNTGTPVWINTGNVTTFPATTTAGSVSLWSRNAYLYRQLGIKEWQVMLIADKGTTANASNGNGDYLFSLPAACPDFDITSVFQSVYQGGVGVSEPILHRFMMPTSHGYANHFVTDASEVGIIPWSARQYRIIIHVPGNSIRAWGSGWFPIEGAFGISVCFNYQSV